MLAAEVQRQLEELRAHVKCPRNFVCLYSNLDDLCKGLYHRDIDIFECLELGKPSCSFARAFGCAMVCTCPMRKFIAEHFTELAADSISVLRAAKQ